jgi:pantothenate kinase
LVEPHSSINIAGKLIDEIYHSAKACQLTFISRNTSQLETLADHLNQLVGQGFDQCPLAVLSTLNTENQKYGYLSNLIVKVAITTFALAHFNRVERNACCSIVKTNLFILYVISPALLQIKNNPKLFVKYKARLIKAA